MTHREAFAAAPVARLATVSEAGVPHLVPITFVCEGDLIHTAIDHKPKTTTRLRRLRNIEHRPGVSVLVDHYEDDWSGLWWVRADGVASVVAPQGEGHAPAAAALAAKYPAYRTTPVTGPIVEIRVERWSSWSAGESGSVAVPG